MSVEVVITGTGAYIARAGEDRRRPVRRGATVTVDDAVAEQLIADGVAVYPGDEPAVEEAVPDGSDGSEVEKSDEEIADLKVEDALAFVGDDQDLAARVLAIEQAKGEKARSTLVDPLEQLLNEGEDEDDG